MGEPDLDVGDHTESDDENEDEEEGEDDACATSKLKLVSVELGTNNWAAISKTFEHYIL